MLWAEISQGVFELRSMYPLNLNANNTEAFTHSLSIITACLSASEASSHASAMAPGRAAAG